MILTDLNTWWVMYSVFLGADSESDICFALNNDPKAQDSYKVGIITAKKSHGNDQWHSLPCVTLTPGQLYMASRYQ